MESIDVINYFEENLKIRVIPCNKLLSPMKEYKSTTLFERYK